MLPKLLLKILQPCWRRKRNVTPAVGLLNPNHYLAVAINYLLSHRPGWSAQAAGGKTLASSGLIDLLVAKLGRWLTGEPITARLTRAPGNNAPIGGLKVVAASGWFAARPSGTEDLYKIYAESFRDEKHLQAIVAEAQHIVRHALDAGHHGRG